MPASAKRSPEPKDVAPARAQNLDTIRTLGRLLDDLEHVRKQSGNRVAALERDYGSSIPHIDVIQANLKAVEHQAELELIRAWRKHPLHAWQKAQPALGEKTFARLISEIGDPGERPNVAKLWAYCGHGEPLRKPAKGMSQEELFKNGNPRAKSLLWVIASSTLKRWCPACAAARGKNSVGQSSADPHTCDAHQIDAGTGQTHSDAHTSPARAGWTPPPTDCTCATYSPYRHVYDQRRSVTLERVHERLCPRCGPSGHPAKPGTPWSAAHQHADAIRIVGKQILLDMWIAARPQNPAEAPNPHEACR